MMRDSRGGRFGEAAQVETASELDQVRSDARANQHPRIPHVLVTLVLQLQVEGEQGQPVTLLVGVEVSLLGSSVAQVVGETFGGHGY